MRLRFEDLERRCKAGENILLLGKNHGAPTTGVYGKGAMFIRDFLASNLKSVAVDTVIYLAPPPDSVRDLCVERVRDSRFPLIIHDY